MEMFRILGVNVRLLLGADEMLVRINRQREGYRPGKCEHDRRLLEELESCSAIIVCSWNPTAFQRELYGIEDLRELIPETPIVFYAVAYLGNIPYLMRWLSDRGHLGVERYDWYLCATDYFAREPASHCHWSHVGMNLPHTGMKLEEKPEFCVLLDFQRDETADARQRQIQWLNELGVRWFALAGAYSMPDIRKIYGASTVYLPQSHESFGIPACEVQAQGGYVLIADATWLPAHRLDPFPLDRNAPCYPESIRVYGDGNEFKRQLDDMRSSANPGSVVEVFRRRYPQYWEGNLDMLMKFVERIAEGKLHEKKPDSRN